MSIDLQQRVQAHLHVIYQTVDKPLDLRGVTQAALELMRIPVAPNSETASNVQPAAHQNHWTEKDVILITYGNSILPASESADKQPLSILKDFLDNYTNNTINSVHILPFFPYCSDDGFAVMDFMAVNNALGDWQDIADIGSDYRLMADLVINHCSAQNQWFKNFIENKAPGNEYFFTADPALDLSQVVRPRTNPLLREVNTASGTRHVWCTFSHDQVDLDFRNPEVLLEFIRIVRYYLDQGVRIFRLDAVAFIWKQPGTNCVNLQETHEIVRLLRLLIEHAQQDAIIITETNIPNRENLEYFGNANEAHCIYNFSLPPLLLHALVVGNSYYLKQWMMSMPPAQNGTTYFNFIASHDGIGLRPTEGLLSEREIDSLLAVMENFGGKVSHRQLANGKSKPYEINISLFDALQGTQDGPDKFAIDRFICAHAIMFALEGIPGIYIHSLFGTRNDYQKLEAEGHNRAINRHQWTYETLQQALDGNNKTDSRSQTSDHAIIFKRINNLLAIRIQQPAFHPNATQFTLHLGDTIFGFWRQSNDRQQSIFCIANIDKKPCTLPLSSVNLIGTDNWRDLITSERYDDYNGTIELQPYQTVWISNR